MNHACFLSNILHVSTSSTCPCLFWLTCLQNFKMSTKFKNCYSFAGPVLGQLRPLSHSPPDPLETPGLGAKHLALNQFDVSNILVFCISIYVLGLLSPLYEAQAWDHDGPPCASKTVTVKQPNNKKQSTKFCTMHIFHIMLQVLMIHILVNHLSQH